MSRFSKLSHVLYSCQYHIVWCPKYRYRVLDGGVSKFIEYLIRQQCEKAGCKITELNIQKDHIHLLVSVPPKISISHLMGILKGKTAIAVFNKYPKLRTKRYWGNHFWSSGYCVDTVGLNLEMIKKYVKYQENK